MPEQERRESTGRRQNDGYLIAKLEYICETLEKHDARTRTLAHSVVELREEVHSYTAQWRAIRWLGGVLLAVAIFIKTGDFSGIKAIFGIGS